MGVVREGGDRLALINRALTGWGREAELFEKFDRAFQSPVLHFYALASNNLRFPISDRFFAPQPIHCSGKF